MAKNTSIKSGTHKINSGLMPLARPVSELREDPKNARAHREADLAILAKSLGKFGQQKPIVALADGTVIAGNGTLTATRDLLQWSHIAVVTFDDADEAKARAFALADNRTAELSSWDFNALGESLRVLPNDLQIDLGFSAKELSAFLADTKSLDIGEGKAHTREIHLVDLKLGATTCPKCGFEFDSKGHE